MDAAWGQMGSSLLSGLGDYFSAQTSADAMERAAEVQADAMIKAQKMAQQYQEEKLGEVRDYYSPYKAFAEQGLGNYQNYLSGTGADIMNQMLQMSQGGLNMDYQNDPAYQWRLAQAEEQAQRQMASIGGLDSRLGLDVVGDRTMALSSEEADKQYNRAVNEYNMAYGGLQDQYNLGYNQALDQYNLGYNAINDLSNITMGVGSNVGNQIMQSGMQSATNSANLLGQAAQLQGNAYSALGNTAGDMLSTYSLSPAINSIADQIANMQSTNTYTPTSTGFGNLNNQYSLFGNSGMPTFNLGSFQY